jgi:hypothetical protein
MTLMDGKEVRKIFIYFCNPMYIIIEILDRLLLNVASFR